MTALRWFSIEASAVDDIDYTAAATLRSLDGILKQAGVRLVFTEVFPNINRQTSCQLRTLLGEAAVLDSLGDVLRQYQQQSQPAAS